MRRKAEYTLLFIIIIFGGFLRIYRLGSSPPSVNWDEASLGYNAYSISHTLKDEYGKLLPVFTRSFDDYKPALSIYLMIPSVKIFGLNEFGVRFPSALLGTISILIIYFICRNIFGNSVISLFSSLFIACEPWSVHFSRTYHEANIANFFLFLGILVFLLSKKRNYLLIVSVLAFCLSMFSYHSNKIIAPVILLIIISLNKKLLENYSKKVLKISIYLFILISIIFVLINFTNGGLSRFDTTSIFGQWPTTAVLRSLSADNHNSLFFKLARNNYYYFFWEIAGRFLSYFSPYNLFIREPLEPISQIPGNSLFYPFEFVFWLVGLVSIFLKRDKYKEIVALLIISPIPSVLTWNWFQPNRVLSLLTVYSVLTAAGVYYVTEWVIKKIKGLSKFFISRIFLYSIIVFYVMISSLYLLDSLNVQLVINNSGAWQPGFRETVPVVMSKLENYQKVVVETPHAQPYIFYLFYGKYPPGKYIRELDLEKIGTPRKVYDFGKFEFRKINWSEDRDLANTLFVGNDENLPDKGVLGSPNVNYIENVKDRWGYIAAKLVGTK